MQHEITTGGKLLDRKGVLTERGYARSLLLQYDRSAVRANKLRIKEWDYYLITNEDFALALTIADNSYMGLVSVSFLNFIEKSENTATIMIPFPNGSMKLPPSSKSGHCVFSNKRVTISFQNSGCGRLLKLQMSNFDGDRSLQAEIVLFDEPRDSMVIATPFQKNPKAFYYNQKIIGMKAKGQVTYGGKSYSFEPGTAFGLLDWGRGVWTYDNTWYWGAAQGVVNGKVFGFNVGYGFGDTHCATENMLFYDGVASKLEHVTFHIPKDTKGADDYLKPWTFTSSDARFEMDFVPLLDRASNTSLGLLCSNQHQVFGRFSGKAVLDDGTVITLSDFLGFAEKVRNKW